MLTDSEGWFFGTSFLSGCSGMYPGNYVEKTKDSDCWTLHRYLQFTNNSIVHTTPTLHMYIANQMQDYGVYVVFNTVTIILCANTGLVHISFYVPSLS